MRPRPEPVARKNGGASERYVPRTAVGAAGVDAREPREHVHADYFVAHQDVFNDRLLDLCLRNAPDSVQVAHPDCGTEPGN